MLVPAVVAWNEHLCTGADLQGVECFGRDIVPSGPHDVSSLCVLSYKFYYSNTRSETVIFCWHLPVEGLYVFMWGRLSSDAKTCCHPMWKCLDLPLSVQLPGLMQCEWMHLKMENYRKCFNKCMSDLIPEENKDKKNNETFTCSEQVKYIFLSGTYNQIKQTNPG